MLALLAGCDNAKLLAGGQSLMPMLAMRYLLPDDLIDLNRVDGLAGIAAHDGVLRAGAMTRQCEIERSALVARCCPLMIEAILEVGHRQTRNRGTLGGSLVHLDPAAELVTVAAALDAVVEVAGPRGGSELAFAAFPVAFMQSALAADELLTAVRFPLWPQGHGWGFVEFARRHGDFAIASAAALLVEDGDGRIERAALAIGGVASVPLRASEVEASIVGRQASEELFRAACESCRAVDALEDVHAPASYRQHLAAVLARRALMKAHGRANRGAR